MEVLSAACYASISKLEQETLCVEGGGKKENKENGRKQTKESP
jgi:hypothetical protein